MARRPRPLRIATWNINSVRLRSARLGDLAAALEPDILCLQETKSPDEHFPLAEVKRLGFRHVLMRGMKGYNGVAILSRLPLAPVEGMPDWCTKGDCRHIAADIDLPGGPVRIHNFYVPAGGDIPDPEANPKFRHKLEFVEEATRFFQAGAADGGRTVLVGDLNIAPLPDDVWSHRQLLDVVSHTPVETEGLTRWLATAGGWVDAPRVTVPVPQKLYTWWSYRNRDWRLSDRGRRLDHVWLTPDLRGALKDTTILKDARDWPQASDHVPVMATLLI
ncbi:exodeoxyribonuclease III [Elioraea rosea]|uniref:exodeoxyribonuclease III n=1 Tax=Elioraea rosea TaxID=2492390 RepID=UPI001182FDBC|nr:exodeoxyribonuclease III [Elioraea rosea]